MTDQALRAYALLSLLHRHDINISYGEFTEIVGGIPRGAGSTLRSVAALCRKNGIDPDPYCAHVVQAKTGKPGKGFYKDSRITHPSLYPWEVA